MKISFTMCNNEGCVLYMCRKHGYLKPEEFFKSDINNRRRSCKICTTTRARKSKTKASGVLDMFKNYCKRHGHIKDTAMWEPCDIEPLLSKSTTQGNVVLRPVDFNSPIWCLDQLKVISKAEANATRRATVQKSQSNPAPTV